MSRGWIGNYSHFRARIHADSLAVVDIDTGERYTYGDLEDRANRLASFLRDRFGVAKGDRVAFLSRNRVEIIDAYYATGKLGAILVPYNARLSVKELGQLARSETPKILFFEDIYAETAGHLKQEGLLEHFVVMRDDKAAAQAYPCYDELLSSAGNTPVCCDELDLEDIHLIIHTGGTTGLPKGGLLSHRCLLFNSFNEICTWGMNHSDRALLLLPLFHTGGWNLLTLPLLHVGGRLYLSRQYDPKKTIEVVEKEKITFLFGAATIFRMMMERPEFAAADFGSLIWAMAGAAPTPINIMKAFWDKGVKCVLGYGMTEAGPNNLSMPAQFYDWPLIEEKYASVGKPMYLTMLKLVDDDGNEIVTPHTPGELFWSGPQIFSGYWGNPQETEKTLADGWVQTGDMAVFDEDGFYYIVGRKKNMFISGGENVFPPEIETALYDIEAVRECCVFGVPDEKWGEAGKAVVALKPGMKLTKEEILSALNEKLARYKVPRYVTSVEDVPKNNVGKIVVAKIVEAYGKAED
ncbi:MAG: AMP-binding protein [Synergistaceae bacterium]|jgi:fatty-acyl-CoA synthase|nr:AMP-binding protein [Synergistaceae bacterium]